MNALVFVVVGLILVNFISVGVLAYLMRIRLREQHSRMLRLIYEARNSCDDLGRESRLHKRLIAQNQECAESLRLLTGVVASACSRGMKRVEILERNRPKSD